MGIIIFMGGLYSAEFTRINCRFALFIGEMKQYGIGVFPTLYDKPYTDYPSTHILMMYLASFGGNAVNMLTATLPSALMAVFILIMTYLLGARVSKWLGGYAVLLCLLSFEFLSIARAPSLDLFVAAATILAFYLIYAADQDKGWKRLLLVPLCMASGFAFRGPLGIVIPSIVVFSYYLVNRKWKMCIVCALVSGLLAVLCMGSLLLLCVQQGGRELLEAFLNDQIVSRFETGKPVWYFFTNGLASYSIAFPLGLLVIIVYFKKLIKKPSAEDNGRIYFLRSIAAWILATLFVMSIPGTKHLRYIVSAIPALALTGAWIFMNFDKLVLFAKIKEFFFAVCRIFPLLALAALIILAIVLKIIGLKTEFPVVLPSILLLLFAVSIVAFLKSLKAEQRDFTLVAIAAATLAVIKILILEPIDQSCESARKFIADVETARQDKAQVCFFKLGPDGDELKYLINVPLEKRFIGRYFFPSYTPPETVSNTKIPSADLKSSVFEAILRLCPEDKKTYPPINPRYAISGCDKMPAMPDNTIYITRTRYYEKDFPEELKPLYEIIVSGKMGHQQCAAFRKKLDKPGNPAEKATK
jgi:4-amino-4-deoxy-L-arabinose transferase-like glycosyltransferase